MGKKTDLLLQLIIIAMTSLIPSLIVLKVYPDWYFTQQKAVDAEKNKVILTTFIKSSAAYEKEVPTEIIIPSVDIVLPIAPGVITGNTWTLYDDKATWLSTSETPGKGNTIIYGHNRRGIFEDLHRLKSGDAIGVQTKKAVYLYRTRKTITISPQDVEAILSANNQLTLYTCDGRFDELRTVVVADYAGTL